MVDQSAAKTRLSDAIVGDAYSCLLCAERTEMWIAQPVVLPTPSQSRAEAAGVSARVERSRHQLRGQELRRPKLRPPGCHAGCRATFANEKKSTSRKTASDAASDADAMENCRLPCTRELTPSRQKPLRNLNASRNCEVALDAPRTHG